MYCSSVFLIQIMCFFFFFFFQAEDGIRDHCVTGVQTCALPIFHLQLPGPGCPRPRRPEAEGEAAAGRRPRGGARRLADRPRQIRLHSQAVQAGRAPDARGAGDLRAAARRLIDRQRTAVSIAFLAFGVTVGGLIPRMPAFKDHLHLTDGQVGIALLGVSLGGIAGALASRLVIHRGASRYVRLGVLALCVAALGPALAANLIALLLSLFLVGFLWGFIDTLENALGAQLERIEGSPLINRLHGFWSLGAFLGSLVAGGAGFLGIGPLQQFIATGVVVAAASALFLRSLPTYGEVTHAGGGVDPHTLLRAAVVAVAAISFAGIIAEGGTSDWSALYLRELSHANAGTAAAGFSGFALAAVLVRFRADRLTAR